MIGYEESNNSKAQAGIQTGGLVLNHLMDSPYQLTTHQLLQFYICMVLSEKK
jgi:hypothetical protein